MGRRGTYSNGADNHGGYGKDDRVKDQDVLDDAEDAVGVHEQVQARVEDPALGYDHDEPGEVDEGDGGHGVLPDAKVGEDDEDGLEDDAPGGEGAGPKVEAAAALEEQEERGIDLEANVPGDADKGGHDHGHGEVLLDVVHGCGRWGASRWDEAGMRLEA